MTCIFSKIIIFKHKKEKYLKKGEKMALVSLEKIKNFIDIPIAAEKLLKK
ncbi:MAG: hypothetical protein NC816_05735 [Candidatus Omnitrophica bacterium]|nr:hypothetical protein [Candidatus Omnitrophota bacterium]